MLMILNSSVSPRVMYVGLIPNSVKLKAVNQSPEDTNTSPSSQNVNLKYVITNVIFIHMHHRCNSLLYMERVRSIFFSKVKIFLFEHPLCIE